MLRFRDSLDAVQALLLVLLVLVLIRIVPLLPLPGAEYYVENGAYDIDTGRDHEDESPFGMSRLKAKNG